jgi:pimeloyl-ACP methyl ester carboxylesterase
MTATAVTTHTLDVSNATLAYDVRRGTGSDIPLFLIGLPMGAAGFGSLAGHFHDRTVITYDPRGSERSRRTDGTTQNAVEEHADDLHRIIQEVGGPVDLFASSGGAVNALDLVARHPDDVRILVAHEPPLATVLPDREAALAASRDMYETYQRSGAGPGMAKFMALTSHRGEIPADWVDRPAPDPAAFGLPTDDDGKRDDPLLSQPSTVIFEPDFDAVRAAPTRIVMAAGAESEGEMPNRGAFAVAERLGTDVVVFPSHHGGFLGGEYGWAGDPDAFAATLRQVLKEA